MKSERVSLILTYALAVLGIGATILHVSLFAAALLVIFATMGLWSDLRKQYPLSGWLLNLLSVAGVLSALALPGAHGVLGRLLSASVVLMGAKLAAPKAPRDRLQIMLLSLLLLVGAAIVSASMSFALLFGLYLILATVNLLWMPFSRSLQGKLVPRYMLRRLSILAAGLLLAAVPFMALFYFGLPRAPASLVPGQLKSTQLSGFTDSISPGTTADIATTNAPALRVVLSEGQGPLDHTPYWRALVFQDTDGTTWHADTQLQSPATPLHSDNDPLLMQGPLITQTVFLEPLVSPALVALDHPTHLITSTEQADLTRHATLQARRVPLQRVRYQVVSEDSSFLQVALAEEERIRSLALPHRLPPSLLSLALSLTQSTPDPLTKAQTLESHFHSEEYKYSLNLAEPAPGETTDPLERFLTTKTGYCEHFASAMALMLRAVGVPSRLVGGYAGGEYNSTGHYYLVRQRSAHAWVEAYIADRGWVRFDPTPPDQGPVAETSSHAVTGFTAFLDTLRLRWYTFVIGYDLHQQLSLFRSIGSWVGIHLAWRPTKAFATWAAAALGVIALGLGAFGWLRIRRRYLPAESLYRSLERRLARAGLCRRPSEGYLHFAQRAGSHLVAERTAIYTVVHAYVAYRYGNRTFDAAELRDLRQMVRSVPRIRLPRQSD
ncbi:MAG: DUF3488 domain-containing transglutaminase family protein [Actinobacteria bacterium]|nr:DUF3488 domain-containing transglutaminase family protein [Actinomycetota bacterium]